MPQSMNEEDLILQELMGEEPIEETKEEEVEVDEQEVEETAEAPEDDSEQEETDESPGPEVDYKLEVPLTNGERVTVGQLKDAYQAQQKTQLEMVERENALMAKQRDVDELAHLVQNLPPELKQRVAAQQEQYLKQEHQRMLDAIPAFKDPDTFKQARDDIFKLAEEYQVIDIIGNVTDHRIVKMLHDYAKLRAGIRNTTENVKPLKATPPPSKTAKRPGKTSQVEQLAAKAKQTKNADVELEAINLLIGS